MLLLRLEWLQYTRGRRVRKSDADDMEARWIGGLGRESAVWITDVGMECPELRSLRRGVRVGLPPAAFHGILCMIDDGRTFTIG